MKLLDIVSQLQKAGHDIVFRVRSDGGLLITSIDGVKYTGAAGNTIARTLAGSSLSAAQQAQRAQNIQKIRKPQLSTEVKKLIVKVQRKWRKHPPKGGGRITTKKVRWQIQHNGEAAALEALRKAERYAEGLAYDANVQHLIDRVTRLYTLTGDDNYAEIIARIQRYRFKFREDWIQPTYDVLYEAEKGTISSETAKDRIFAIIK